MELIIFIHQDSSTKGSNLKKAIGQNFKRLEIHIPQTFNALKARLDQVSNYNEEIYILLADSKKRLTELTSLIELLKNKRVIIVLPNKSKTVVSCVHQFLPRYFTYMNDTYDDLCAVINMLVNKNREKLIQQRRP